MNGLVSGYGSASDEEESTSVPNVQKITSENGKKSYIRIWLVISVDKFLNMTALTEWLECMDNTTGYPYYWNRYAISISFTFYFPYDIFSWK